MRWTGKVEPRYSETYTFYTNASDGVRLWVDGVKIIGDWNDHGVVEKSGQIALTASQLHTIELEYYENTNRAVCQLSWSSASQAKEIVPQSQLYPASVSGTNAAPQVAITSPISGITVATPATISLNAQASDPDGVITKVAFFRGATKLGEDDTAPYSFSWANAPTGSHSITAQATDDSGAVTTSDVVTLVTSNPPTVAITSPANGTEYLIGETVSTVAQAADSDGTVSQIEISLSGTPYVTSNTSPATLSWTAYDPGTRIITAKATDNVGLTTNAAPVTVTFVRPVVTISATDALATEGSTDTASLTFSRTGPTTSPLMVAISRGGTASGGNDYDFVSTSVTIPAGSSSITVPVSAIDDEEVEPQETLTVTISSSPLYTAGSPTSATVTIVDNDVLPTVSVTTTDSQAFEAPASDTGKFTVARTGNTSKPLTVYFTTGGSATLSSDYYSLGASAYFPAGASTASVVVSAIDDTSAEGDETVSITLTANSAYQIGTPGSASLTVIDDDLKLINITSADTTATEAGDNGSVTLSRTGGLTSSLVVSYTFGGTAINGSDYLSPTGTITFAAGASTVTLPVFPLDDGEYEGTETVIFALAPGTGYVLGTSTSTTINITDDDRPTVSIIASDATASEAGDTGMLTVMRSGITTDPLTVTLAVSGSATNGLDYVALSSSVVIPAGSASSALYITPYDDSLIEGTENVIVAVTGSANYNIGTASAEVALADNDLPTVSVAATDASASEPGTNTGTFTITRTGPTTNALGVSFTVGGTATAGSDYQALSTTVTIPAGVSTATVTVQPLDDTLVEPSETVTLSLTDSSLYTVGTRSATVTILDNEVNTPPTVSITSPLPNAQFGAPATIDISASAGDVDGTVTRVDFYAGSTLIGSDASSPYSISWSNVAAGSYTLTARAIDNLSAVGTSSGVNVTVVNAAAGATRAYVANYGSSSVSVIDYETQAVLTTIPVDAGPAGVAVSPNATNAYVTCYSANTLKVVSTITNTVSATIAMGTQPLGVAVSPDGRRVFATNYGSNTVSVINTATNTVAATIGVGIHPYGVAFSSDGRFAFVTNTDSNTVSVINTQTNAIIKNIGVGLAPKGITAVPNTGLLYVANSGESSVSVLSPESLSVVNAFAVAANPRNVAGLPDGTELLVTHPGSNQVTVLNLTDDVYKQTLSVATTPNGVAVEPAGGTFIITTESDARARLFDSDNYGGTLTSNFITGNMPGAVAVANLGAPNPSLGSLGATVSGQVTLQPSVVDVLPEDPATRYELYVDGVLASDSDRSRPQLLWDSETAANGSHTLVLRAVTRDGTVGLSAPLSVNTSNSYHGISLSRTDFDGEAPSNEFVTLSGSLSGATSWTVEVVDAFGGVVFSQSGTGSTYAVNWNGVNQNTGQPAEDGAYAFQVRSAALPATKSAPKGITKNKKGIAGPALLIVFGVNANFTEAATRLGYVVNSAKATGTPYKVLRNTNLKQMAPYLKNGNCRYFYFFGHGGVRTNGTSLTDDPVTGFSPGGGMQIESHIPYWGRTVWSKRANRFISPRGIPTIQSLGLRTRDQFRFVYLDGCDTGDAAPASGLHDVYDYFGLQHAPVEESGLYLGWKGSLPVPQPTPTSYLYWNDRYFQRVGGGKTFGTALFENMTLSPVDNDVKNAVFQQGAGTAWMHP